MTRAVRRTLPVALDRDSAEDLLEWLRKSRGRPVVLDASRADRITVPALEVLLSAAATWRQDGIRFEVKQSSTPFTRALTALAIDPAALSVGC